ncbi:MAG: FHA domain-containing protein [Chloroflexota bacterium]
MPQYQLVVRRGPRAGETFELKSQTVIIGRDSTADIIINDPEVSRNHCRLILDRSYYLQDLGSTNGTFIDGQRLGGEPVRLANGQIIQLGSNVTLLHQEIETSDAIVSTRIQPGGEQPSAVPPASATPPPPPPPAQQPPFTEQASSPPQASFPDRGVSDRLPNFSDTPNPDLAAQPLPMMDGASGPAQPVQEQYTHPPVQAENEDNSSGGFFSRFGGGEGDAAENGGAGMPWSNWTQRQWIIAIAILFLLLLCTCCVFITTIVIFLRPDLVTPTTAFSLLGFY